MGPLLRTTDPGHAVEEISKPSGDGPTPAPDQMPGESWQHRQRALGGSPSPKPNGIRNTEGSYYLKGDTVRAQVAQRVESQACKTRKSVYFSYMVNTFAPHFIEVLVLFAFSDVL